MQRDRIVRFALHHSKLRLDLAGRSLQFKRIEAARKAEPGTRGLQASILVGVHDARGIAISTDSTRLPFFFGTDCEAYSR